MSYFIFHACKNSKHTPRITIEWYWVYCETKYHPQKYNVFVFIILVRAMNEHRSKAKDIKKINGKSGIKEKENKKKGGIELQQWKKNFQYYWV